MLNNKFSELNISFLDQSQLDQLSSQQKKWAQNQFKLLYAQQMSKITSDLIHQNKIKNNLQTIQNQQFQQINQTSKRLKSKMDTFQQKRQKQFNQKQKSYQLNQQKWTKKIQDIQTKFRHQNREAIQKAQKYRQQSQDYWRTKQSQLTTARGTSYQKFDLNKTQKVVAKNINESLSKSNHKQSFSINKKNKYMEKKVDTLVQADQSSIMISDTSRGNLKNSRTIDIDGQISKHKQRSQLVQKQRQMIVFQNAMKRLAKIQMTRRKAQKIKQSSKSPVQIRKPKKHAFDDDDNLYNSESNTHRKNQSINISKSKQSLLNESIQSHIKAKRLLEQLQIKERDKLVQNQHKKKRQDKILKAIKNKIKDIKSSTIKMQTLQ